MSLQALELVDNNFLSDAELSGSDDGSADAPELSDAARAVLARRQVTDALDLRTHIARTTTRAEKRAGRPERERWGVIAEQALTTEQQRDMKMLKMRHVLRKENFSHRADLSGADLHGDKGRVHFGTTVVSKVEGPGAVITRRHRGRSMFEEAFKDEEVRDFVGRVDARVRVNNARGCRRDQDRRNRQRARGKKRSGR